MNKHTVFVYGTLKRGLRNAHFMTDAELIAETAWTYGDLYDTGNDCPALVLTDEKRLVFGELYKVGDKTLAELNELEGYVGDRNFNDYDRITRTVYTESEPYFAFVYTYNEHQVKAESIIDGGRWR